MVGVANASISLADIVVVAGLDPIAAKQALAEGNADALDNRAVWGAFVLVVDHDDAEDNIIGVYFGVMGQLISPNIKRSIHLRPRHDRQGKC